MPTHDRLCKQFLLESLDPLSRVIVHMTVAPQDDQYVDNFCIPKPNPPPPATLTYLGPLRDMASEVCMIESSMRPPSPADIDNNQRKQLNLQLQLIKENDGRYVERPRLWVLSAGRPRQAIRHCRFEPDRSRTQGFYEVADWLRLGLVVLSELPETRETLALRLLGSRRQRKQAMKELAQISPTDPAHGPILAIVDKVRYFLKQATEIQVDAEEREIMTELGKQWEKHRVAEFDRRHEEEMREKYRRDEEKMREKYRREGAVDTLRQTILTVLHARHLPSSKALAKRIQTCTDDAILKRWLERAAVANTPAEVFAEG